MKEVPISVEAIDNGFIFDIIVALYHSADSAVVRICRYHTNIVFIQKNSDILLDNTAAESKPACGGDNPAEDDLSDKMCIRDRACPLRLSLLSISWLQLMN